MQLTFHCDYKIMRPVDTCIIQSDSFQSKHGVTRGYWQGYRQNGRPLLQQTERGALRGPVQPVISGDLTGRPACIGMCVCFWASALSGARYGQVWCG